MRVEVTLKKAPGDGWLDAAGRFVFCDSWAYMRGVHPRRKKITLIVDTQQIWYRSWAKNSGRFHAMELKLESGILYSRDSQATEGLCAIWDYLGRPRRAVIWIKEGQWEQEREGKSK